jgi:hypothetical protein
VFWRRRTGRQLFRLYELAVLDGVLAELAPEARILVERQIASTGHVQRLFDDSDVALYVNRRQNQRRDERIALPNRSTDLKLATVGIRGSGGSGKVVVRAVTGHVFELTFRPSPKKLGDRRRLEVTHVTIHADPMLPDDGASAELRLADLDPDLRKDLERRWANGSAASDGLLGRDEVYPVELEDGTYLMLGQLVDTTMLGAPIEPRGGGVRRFDPGGALESEHASLAEAISAASSQG